MEMINGVLVLVLVAAYIGLVIDVRGVRKDQREYLDAILSELRQIREGQ